MLTREQVVEEIRESAEDWRQAGLECEEESLKSAYIQDAIDLRIVADLLEAGTDQAAYRWAYRLDTIVRECMSEDVWDFLEQFDDGKGW